MPTAKLIDRGSLILALEDLGLETNEDNIAQMQIFVRAMEIYQQREAKHHGLWKRQDELDTIHHMTSKFERTKDQVQCAPLPDMDDGYDLLNYTAFLIRRVLREGWPD